MNSKLNKPKGFGEILDSIFNLSKTHFKEFMTIILILLGPVYLLQAIFQLAGGTSFLREGDGGGTLVDQFLSGFNGEVPMEDINLDGPAFGFMIMQSLMELIALILLPVAGAAILLIINRLRKGESYTLRTVMKQAFSRFWPLIGSSILFSLIIFGIVFIPIFFIGFAGAAAAIADPVVGIIVAIVLGLGFAVGFGYLLTRWSLYFGSVTLKEESPGFSRSWRLSKNRGWILFGLFVVLSLVIFCVTFAFELTFTMLLGPSVLYSIISNIVYLFMTMISFVGYAVIYLDAKIRHDADDLKELIEDYEVQS